MQSPNVIQSSQLLDIAESRP